MAASSEMRPDRDIDLPVEFIPEVKVDLIDHAGLLLGRRVDLVSKKRLKTVHPSFHTGRSTVVRKSEQPKGA